MLGRFQMKRGASLAAQPERVQRGVRVDTRKHTRHCLRPTEELVAGILDVPPERRDTAWKAFERAYTKLLDERFAADRAPFDALAAAARDRDVFLGCNCPTARQPDVRRCHTVLALRFMARRYPDLVVEIP